MLGVYCGIDETILDECTYVYYKDCISELSMKLKYDAIVHILGNSFIEGADEIVKEYDPFLNDPNEIKQPHKLTLEEIQNAGFEIKKLDAGNVKLIKDMM